MEPAKIYHPLDGTELLEWLLHSLKKKLSGYGEFSVGRAYHNPYYKVSIEVLTFQPEDAKTKWTDQTAEQAARVELMGNKETSPEPLEKMNRIKFYEESEEPVFEPDRVREEVGLGTYTTVKDGEILVDKKETP